MGSSIADAKKAWLKAALGGSVEEDIPQLEWLFYSANSGLTPIANYSLTDHKRAFLVLKTGLTTTSTTDGIERYWHRNIYGALGSGVQTYSAADTELDFYLNHPYTGI